jgi:hypothetical protein
MGMRHLVCKGASRFSRMKFIRAGTTSDFRMKMRSSTRNSEMTKKQRGKTAVRKTAGDNPPPVSKATPPGSAQKSPLSADVEAQAQQLIHETGSPTAAKSAVDVAAERERAPDFQEDHFAQRWGFASRALMRGASKPLVDIEGNSWWATQLPSGRWVVWNKENMAASRSFESLPEARQSLAGALSDRPRKSELSSH